MPKFEFRLETVRQLRVRQQEEAERRYLEAVARRIQAERHGQQIRAMLMCDLRSPAESMAERMGQGYYADRLSDQARDNEVVIDVLRDEEKSAERIWLAAKSQREAMDKLHEQQYSEWRICEMRREQNELDEIAVQRRMK